jgi:hypothetical protein
MDFANADIIAKPACFSVFIYLLLRWWWGASYACFQSDEKRIKQNAQNGENNQLAKHWHHPQFDLWQKPRRASGGHVIPLLSFYSMGWHQTLP